MGDFRLKISDVQNETLRKLMESADRKDAGEKGYLESEEISIYLERLEGSHVTGLDEKDYEMGLAIVKENAKEKSEEVVTNPVQKSKKEEKRDAAYAKLKAKYDKYLEKYNGNTVKALESVEGTLNPFRPSQKKAYKRLKKEVHNNITIEKIKPNTQNYATGNTDALYENNYHGSHFVKLWTEVGYKNAKDIRHKQKVARDKVESEKRLEELKHVTEKEMLDKLKLKFAGVISVEKGKTFVAKLKPYMDAHKAGLNEKGEMTYDLSGLRTDETFGIGRRHGSDARANRHVDDGSNGLSERDHIRNDLNTMLGTSLNEYESEKLSDFLGIKNQNRDHSIGTAFLGEGNGNEDKSGVPGVAGAAVGATVTPVIVNNKYIRVAAESASEILSQLGQSAVDYTADSEGYITIEIHKIEDWRGFAAFVGMLEAIAVETALKAIMGTEVSEKTCINLSDLLANCKSLDGMKKYVDAKYKNNQKAEILKSMAESYVEMAKLNNKSEREGLIDFLDHLNEKVGGVGSTINPDECYGMMLDNARQKEDAKKNVDNKGNNEVKNEENNNNDKKDDVDNKTEDNCIYGKDPGVDFKFAPRKEKFTSWQQALNGYECLKEDKSFNKAIKMGKSNKYASLSIRMIKVMQAIDPSGAQSEKDIQKLYNVNTIAAFAEEAIRNGIDSAMEKYPEVKINKADYLSVLKGNALDTKRTYTPTLYNNDGSVFCEWNKATATFVKQQTGNGTATKASVSEKQAEYHTDDSYYRQCNGGAKESATQAEYDEYMKNRKK